VLLAKTVAYRFEVLDASAEVVVLFSYDAGTSVCQSLSLFVCMCVCLCVCVHVRMSVYLYASVFDSLVFTDMVGCGECVIAEKQYNHFVTQLSIPDLLQEEHSNQSLSDVSVSFVIFYCNQNRLVAFCSVLEPCSFIFACFSESCGSVRAVDCVPFVVGIEHFVRSTR